jgi:hypothetical protein
MWTLDQGQTQQGDWTMSKKLLTRLNVTRLKTESIEWKKTFFSYMSDKELINRIYGELRN